MNVGGAYGGGKAGASFDLMTFVQRPQVILRGCCWVSLSNNNNIPNPNEHIDLCLCAVNYYLYWIYVPVHIQTNAFLRHGLFSLFPLFGVLVIPLIVNENHVFVFMMIMMKTNEKKIEKSFFWNKICFFKKIGNRSK